jgi:hypothetical protein
MEPMPMRAHTDSPLQQNQQPGAASTRFAIFRFWRTGAVVAAIMVVLALVGVGLTTIRRAEARRYWIYLVPVYGLLCVATAWLRSRQEATFGIGAVVRQVLHWLGVGAAVALDFYVTGTGEEAGFAAGLNALLLLAVGCFLAGVHLEWLFMLVGLLLALTLICAVKADQYLWIIVVGGALALAVALVAARLRRRFSRSASSGTSAAESSGSG